MAFYRRRPRPDAEKCADPAKARASALETLAGQEVSAVHTPSLFEREPIDWTGEDLSPLLRKLYDIKKRLPTDAAFHVEADDEQGLAVADYRDGQHLAVGVFPLAGRPGTAAVPLADGNYENALTGESVTVREGRLAAAGPVIIL